MFALGANKTVNIDAKTAPLRKGTCPLTLEEFRVKALKQVNLFYSQGSTRQAIYKKSMLKFYLTHIPHEKYHEFKCITGMLYGHI